MPSGQSVIDLQEIKITTDMCESITFDGNSISYTHGQTNEVKKKEFKKKKKKKKKKK